VKPIIHAILWSCSFIAGAAFAQNREFGVIGGYGYAPTLTLTGLSGTAQTGFRNGGAFGVYLAENPYKHLGGEIRYLYRMSDMKLSSGGTSTDFAAHSHIVHMDLLAYFQPPDSRTRAFIAFGAGVKVIQGTGMESSFQPLHQFAALTKTLQALPTGDVGAGVKLSLRHHLRIRFEARDYISPQPGKVITAAPGVRLAGMLHDILALAALSYTW
jgi:hypothetical protein